MNSSGDEDGCFSSADDEPPGLVEAYSANLSTRHHSDNHHSFDRHTTLPDHGGSGSKGRNGKPLFSRPQRVLPARPRNGRTAAAAAPVGAPSPRCASNPRTRAFRRTFFPAVTDRDWNDWRWQSRHRIRTLADFERMLRLSDEERNAMLQGGTMLPVGVTPYYLSLLDADDPQHPLRKTVVPSTAEFIRTAGEADDPLGEDGHSPVPGLVHRYPDRVLLLALDFCSTYCRYCTRSRVVGHGEIAPSESRLEAILDYLRGASRCGMC